MSEKKYGRTGNLMNTVSEYVANKLAQRYDLIFRITPESSYYIHVKTGAELTQKEVDEMFPINKNLLARENVDGTKSWNI